MPRKAGVFRCSLTLHAWWLLLVFDGARLAGFSHIHRRLRRAPTRAVRSAAAAADDILWAVDEACVWYAKRVACLQRSAVATWLLRRHGIAATLVIGYRPIPFDSHAWVEVDGRVVNDRPEYPRYYTVLERV